MRRVVPAVVAAALIWGVALEASAQRTYTVRSGDTLARIARRFHTTVAAIQRANRLRGTNVRLGRRLTIPAHGRWSGGVRARRYTVRAGDTLARIARRYHITVESLRAANRMRGTSIRPGDTLVVPRRGESGARLGARLRRGNPVTAENPEVDEEVAEDAEALASELGVGPTPVAQRTLREGSRPEWIEAAGAADDLEGTLLLPVEDGRFLRGWGSGQGGYHLAVDIGAPEGTTVRAAEAGVVIYNDHGVRGYGNMILIAHANGWVTAYAHNRVNLVVPGQRVTRGQPIAEVGHTGFARGPHVHFILVFEGEHCDPTPLFRPNIMRPNGQEPDTAYAEWTTEHRPSAVQCLRREARPHPYYSRERRTRARRRRRARSR